MIDIVTSISGCHKPIVHDSARLRPDHSEVLVLQAKVTRLSAAIDWYPRIGFRQGLVRAMEWWRRRFTFGKVRTDAVFMT
jgi:nucleoside-diphosphate-sugar epimerase